MGIMALGCKSLHWIGNLCDKLQDLTLLLVRVWVAEVFFSSGLTKIQSFDQTIALFEHEYQVPFLSPEIAAYLGTGAELILPVLLAFGFLGRLPAIGLFLFNIAAVVSYPFLWTNAGAAGLDHHIHWGLLLLMLTVFGHGKWSLDGLMGRWCKRGQ